jgi:hypothetical protein
VRTVRVSYASKMDGGLWAIPFATVKGAPTLHSLSLGVETSVARGHKPPRLLTSLNLVCRFCTVSMFVAKLMC